MIGSAPALETLIKTTRELGQVVGLDDEAPCCSFTFTAPRHRHFHSSLLFSSFPLTSGISRRERSPSEAGVLTQCIRGKHADGGGGGGVLFI